MSTRFHEPVMLNTDKLFSSVGACGTNTPTEVKKLQRMISLAGYQQATGRTLKVNGHCDQSTVDAISWYQHLLNMSPSGLVMPVDTYFMQALSHVLSPHWRPRPHSGPLNVNEGQITFDAEGVDYLTAVEPFRQRRYPNFSRILQWPAVGNSGVTLGRGYDMGSRSQGEIHSTLRQAGIEEYKAVLCSKATHLKGQQAGQFVKVYGPLVGEITHHQQIRLFEIAYREKLNYAKGVYNRRSQHLHNALPWSHLDQKIKDVFVDTIYQGNVTAPQMVDIMANRGTREDIIQYLNDDIYQRRDIRRFKMRVRSLQ